MTISSLRLDTQHTHYSAHAACVQKTRMLKRRSYRCVVRKNVLFSNKGDGENVGHIQRRNSGLYQIGHNKRLVILSVVVISGVYCTVNKSDLTTYHTSKSHIQLLYSCHFATPQLISWLFQRAVQTLKRLSVSSSLLWNNILSFGFWMFGGWCHKWGSFRPFWLRLLHPKMQGGSISLT